MESLCVKTGAFLFVYLDQSDNLIGAFICGLKLVS